MQLDCNISWKLNKLWVTVKNPIVLGISANHNMGSSSSLHCKICHMIYLFKMFIILWRILKCAIGYLVMILSAILAISLKHYIIFETFLEILLGIKVTSLYTHVRWQSKNRSQIIFEFILFDFLLKALCR